MYCVVNENSPATDEGGEMYSLIIIHRLSSLFSTASDGDSTDPRPDYVIVAVLIIIVIMIIIVLGAIIMYCLCNRQHTQDVKKLEEEGT